ncbi:hypothetical protein A33Q_0094 [Indibacter alkaliphilus LW1]|uniref:Uncharacterized protein n=1 Tax=Indibacter alkaliphilus (strain CCUG 57479 / KCTC 22604 / LW1) TaxID=1189612 RepID=S2EDN9_INDAL|nr:hypothetical protein A33Q_0094 [Indibacter alkaliphilus LW1]
MFPDLFQFLYGAIEGDHGRLDDQEQGLFQFLYGAIEGRPDHHSV